MLKVFLVEDEFTVRERMKRNINWEEHGFVLVGEAGDGEIAYPMILENKPDIIITDIKMPFMDGLELSRLVRTSMPQVKIIILSGYDEFDYAKQAIGIGITDYLLKPIAAKKLIESMKKVALIIERERIQEAHLKQHLASEEESKESARKRFFNELVTCKHTTIELLDRAKALGIELVSPSYNVLLLKVLLEEVTFNNYNEVQSSLNEKLSKWCMEEAHCILFNRETEGWAILLKKTLDKGELVEEKVVERLQKMMEDYQVLSYCIGVGHQVQRISEISTSFDAASKALAYRYLLSDNQVIYYDQLEQYSMTPENEHISISDVDVTKFEQRTVNDFLRTGIKGQAGDFAREYLQSMGQGSDSLLFRQYIMMDIYLNVVSFIEQLGYEKAYILEACGDIKEMTTMLQTKGKATRYLEDLLIKALLLRDEIGNKRYSNLLEDAKAYIQQNYNKETISLNSVAEYVNVSASHFSAIFSQEMGQTFISYLTEIRMKKAKELLRCSAMKTLEVGFAVGYKDPHYFSYLFKKTQNCTPKEYRKLNSEKY